MPLITEDFASIADALRRLRADSPVPPAKQGCRACDWNGFVWRFGHSGGLGKVACDACSKEPVDE